MHLFITYTKLQLKRSFKVLIRSVVSLLLAGLLLCLAITAISYTFLQKQLLELVTVAVVVPESENFSQLGIQYISSMESVAAISSFQEVNSTEHALEKLSKGEVQAVLVIPENFFNDLNYGVNTPAVMYFPTKPDLTTSIFCQLVQSGVSMLQISESGVYALLHATSLYEPTMSGNIGDYVALQFANEALNRNNVYDAKIASPFGNINFYQYYFATAILLILLMSGLHMGFLYEKQNRPVSEKLLFYGMNSSVQTITRLICMSLPLWLESILISGAALLLQKQLGILFWSGLPTGSNLELTLQTWLYLAAKMPWMLLLCLSVAAYFHLLYEIADNGLAGAILVLICNLAFMITGGAFLPIAYLPTKIQPFTGMVPVSYWCDYLAGIIRNRDTASGLLPVVIILVLFSSIGTLLKTIRRKMNP